MKIKTRYFEVLSKIRRLSHNRARDFINREEKQKQLFEICQNHLILDPAADYEEHCTPLADLLLYKNLYRSLYLYLQGALFSEIYSDSLEKNTSVDISWKLEEDDSFLEVQKRELKLQMGLFAYADATENWNLRYLYGPHDLPQDRLKTFPHFYIKPFYCHEKEGSPGRYEFKTVDQHGFWDHSRTFYYGRTNIHYRKLDFVQILQAKKGNPHWQRRTGFERDMDIIYSSEGEMGACTLAWLMLCICQEKTKEIDNTISKKEPETVIRCLRDIKFNFHTKKKELKVNAKPGNREPELLVPWIAVQKEETLFYWLYKLGLIKNEIAAQTLKVTERGYRLIKWLALYLKSLGGNSLSILGYNEPTYYRIIRGVQQISLDDFPGDKRRLFIHQLSQFKAKEDSLASQIYRMLSTKSQEQISYYLESGKDNPDDQLMGKIIFVLNNILEEGAHLPWKKWFQEALASTDLAERLKNIREPFCQRRMILHSHFPNSIREPDELFPSWLDGIDINLVENFIKAVDAPGREIGLLELLQVVHLFIKWKQRENSEEFENRCRFNLQGHLTLRSGRQRQYHIETASRAWIVFPVHYDYTDYQESSGVLSVGFFLGTFKDSTDEGYGYFDYFDKYGRELTERIIKIRQIMDLLAQVENREIYIRDIYNIQVQEAMENQHKWTIHEIRNEISSIKGYIYEFNSGEIIKRPDEILKEFENLKNSYDEFELVLNWVTELMNGKKINKDEKWVSHEDLKWAFDAFVIKMMSTDEMSSFFDIEDDGGNPLFEDNHDNVFSPSDVETQYYLPYFTYQKLLHELSKNIMKYADRKKKCLFMFHVDEEYLTITTRNTFRKNHTEMLSTGKGLELFERFLKVYHPASSIDRSGLLNKNLGDKCVCKVKIAIKIRRKNKNDL